MLGCVKNIGFYFLVLLSLYSSPSLASWSVSFQYGYSPYKSSSLDFMNENLASSVRLVVPKNHGILSSKALAVAWATRSSRIFLEAALVDSLDSISPTPRFATDTIKVSSSFSALELDLRFGFKIWQSKRSRVSWASPRPQFSWRVDGLLGLGLARSEYSYEFLVPDDANFLAYKVRRYDSYPQVGLRTSFALTSTFELHFDLVFSSYSRFDSKQLISRFIVNYQDQRYRSEQLELEQIEDAKWSKWSALLGLRYHIVRKR